MEITKSEIIRYLKDNKSEFEDKYSIDTFGLFGSYARDEAYENSDIDIVYILKKGKTLSYFELFNLEKKLEKHFNRRVELINYRYINPIVKYKSSNEIIYV